MPPGHCLLATWPFFRLSVNRGHRHHDLRSQATYARVRSICAGFRTGMQVRVMVANRTQSSPQLRKPGRRNERRSFRLVHRSVTLETHIDVAVFARERVGVSHLQLEPRRVGRHGEDYLSRPRYSRVHILQEYVFA